MTTNITMNLFRNIILITGDLIKWDALELNEPEIRKKILLVMYSKMHILNRYYFLWCQDMKPKIINSVTTGDNSIWTNTKS
jgi:hypothetical protein